jgi:ubiquitin-like modifier-activating enzyme 5
MGIIAGFLVQNALKYLLKFGSVTHYLGYNALEDFFPTMSMKPNPNCDDSFCVKRQKEYNALPKVEKVVITEEEVVHEDNDWGITVVDESVNVEENLEIASGLKLAYGMTTSSDVQSIPVNDSVVEQSLEELMDQMKRL